MTEKVLPTRLDADDQPVRDQIALIEVCRAEHGDWLLTLTTMHGKIGGNFGPRPGNMLAGLFDYLREINVGDWTAFNRETGAAI